MKRRPTVGREGVGNPHPPRDNDTDSVYLQSIIQTYYQYNAMSYTIRTYSIAGIVRRFLVKIINNDNTNT